MQPVVAAASLIPLLAMIVLVRQRPFLTHVITALLAGYILVASTPADWKPVSHMCHPDLNVDEYSWFFPIKKLFVVAAYAVCLLMSVFPGSRAVGSFFSFGVFLNLILCVVLTAVENDWVVCIGMLILAPFFPVQIVSEVGDEWTHAETDHVCGVFPMRMRFSARTYMRCHYVVLSAFHLFTDHVGGEVEGCGSRIYLAITCVISLLSMELSNAKRSPCRDFMIRSMGALQLLTSSSYLQLTSSSYLQLHPTCCSRRHRRCSV